MSIAEEKKKSIGRRLSWADQAEVTAGEAKPLVSPIPTSSEGGKVEPEGVLSVPMGILRLGNVYGVDVVLPPNSKMIEVVPPLPDGIIAEVKLDGDLPMLRLQCSFSVHGRREESFHVRLQGAPQEQLEVRVEASVMSPQEGRPSRINENVQLIRAANPEVVKSQNEASEWRRGSLVKDPEIEEEAI